MSRPREFKRMEEADEIALRERLKELTQAERIRAMIAAARIFSSNYERVITPWRAKKWRRKAA